MEKSAKKFFQLIRNDSLSGKKEVFQGIRLHNPSGGCIIPLPETAALFRKCK